MIFTFCSLYKQKVKSSFVKQLSGCPAYIRQLSAKKSQAVIGKRLVVKGSYQAVVSQTSMCHESVMALSIGEKAVLALFIFVIIHTLSM